MFGRNTVKGTSCMSSPVKLHFLFLKQCGDNVSPEAGQTAVYNPLKLAFLSLSNLSKQNAAFKTVGLQSVPHQHIIMNTTLICFQPQFF